MFLFGVLKCILVMQVKIILFLWIFLFFIILYNKNIMTIKTNSYCKKVTISCVSSSPETLSVLSLYHFQKRSMIYELVNYFIE